MEVVLRIFASFLLLVRVLSWPFYWLYSCMRVEALPPPTDPLLFISATELAEKIRSGKVRSADVVEAYVSRIRQVNGHLNAVVEERFQEAAREAEEVDRLVATGQAPSLPLLGVPLTVKESCRVKGMSICVGNLRRRGMKSEEDGEAVGLLKKAGAIPLCVTNTPELCLSWETNNLVKGRTNNPYNLQRTSGGSSGGEGALLGAGASLISVGSDIAGSIRIPAMYNGVYGHKPTPGYISTEGHYPYSSDPDFHKFLQLGPLTRYPEDLRLMLKVMAGKQADGLKLDEKVNIENLRVFFMENSGFSLVIVPTDSDIKDKLYEAVHVLHSKYGAYAEKAHLSEMGDAVEISCSLFFALQDVPNLLQDPQNPKVTKSLGTELIKSLFGLSEISFFALCFYFLYFKNAFIPRSKYEEYKKQKDILKEKLIDFLGDDGVWLFPTFPTPAGFHFQTLVRASGVLYTMIFNILQMPATHVHLGYNKDGLPIGIQVVASPHQDRLCLAVAETLAKELGGWIPPNSLEST